MQLLSAVNSQGVLLDIKVSAQEILHKTEGSKIVSICELLLRLPFFFFFSNIPSTTEISLFGGKTKLNKQQPGSKSTTK